MYKSFLFTLLIIAALSCTDDSVSIVKESGNLTGTILPVGISAEASIKQGEFYKSVTVDELGQFKIRDIDPGVYTFIAKAENFGSLKREEVKIEDGEGYEIGIIELDTIPYPLLEISELYLTRSRQEGEFYCRISFEKFMLLSSLKKYVTIDPIVENLDISSSSSIDDSRYSCYLNGDFVKNVEYTIHLDKNVETYWGENLEFSYSTNISYLDDYQFILKDIYPMNIESSHQRIILLFSKYLAENFEDHLSIIPDIPVELYTSGNRLNIYPLNSWIPSTDLEITLRKDLSDSDGNKFGKDTTLVFTTSDLSIDDTSPRDGQILFANISSVTIDMNFMIDPNSLTNNSIDISPELDFSVGYSPRFYNPEIYIFSENFQKDTEYHITINTNLKDYWGTNLKEPFSFSFKTGI